MSTQWISALTPLAAILTALVAVLVAPLVFVHVAKREALAVQLYQAMDGGQIVLREYLGRLAAGFEGLFPGVRVRVRPGGDALTLDLDRAIDVGLIVNEVITNAAKHAFPKAHGGEDRWLSLKSDWFGAVVVAAGLRGAIDEMRDEDRQRHAPIGETPAQRTAAPLGRRL